MSENYLYIPYIIKYGHLLLDYKFNSKDFKHRSISQIVALIALDSFLISKINKKKLKLKYAQQYPMLLIVH